MGKKALVVVSFGTAWPEARRAIEKLEERLRCAFPTHWSHRLFTSGMVARRIEREEGVHIPQPEELLERLAAAGYDEVRCQSLHVIFGQEYEKMLRQLRPFCGRFEKLLAGDPLLWGTGDYLRLTEALLARMPRPSTGTRPISLWGMALRIRQTRRTRWWKTRSATTARSVCMSARSRDFRILTMCCPACTSARSRRFTLRR